MDHDQNSPNNVVTRHLYVLESLERLVNDTTAKITGLCSAVETLSFAMKHLQSDVREMNRTSATIACKLDIASLRTSRVQAESIFNDRQAAALHAAWSTWTGDAPRRVRPCRPSAADLPSLSPAGRQGSIQSFGWGSFRGSMSHRHQSYPRFSSRRERPPSFPSLSPLPPMLPPVRSPSRDAPDGSHYLAMHSQLSPEEVNKRARMQRIHSRLVLLHPRRLTWAYVRKHLASPSLRAVLGRDILRAVFGVQGPRPERCEPGSRLIHPSSPFHTGFETACVLLLICTILLVPLELSFWSRDDLCAAAASRRLRFTMAADLFFLVDLFYRFFVGVLLPGGVYLDDPSEVARRYLAAPGGFWFNLLTSVPFGWIDWVVAAALCGGGGSGASDYAQHLAFARAIKPIRALKLVRLLRLSAIWDNVLILLDLPPVFFRAFKTGWLIVISLHLSACGFWRLKLETDPDGLVTDLLGSRGLAEDDLGSAYVLCLYFMVTIFATVGFGDVAAATTAERIFVTLLMLVETILFSRLLGDMHDMLQVSTREQSELAERMDGVVAFLRANHVPTALQRRIRAWVGFRLVRDRADAQLQEVLGMLPEDLRHGVAVSVNGGLFKRVHLLHHVHDPLDRAQLAAALLPRLRLFCHPRGAVVASHRDQADRLMVVLVGRVSMHLPAAPHERQGSGPALWVLCSGDSIGDASVVGDERWAGRFGIDADFVALEDCQVAYIYTREILEVLEDPALMRVKKDFQQLYHAGRPTSPHQGDGTSHRCGLPATPSRLRAIFRWIRLSQAALYPPDDDTGAEIAAADTAKKQTRAGEGQLSREAGQGRAVAVADSGGGGDECEAALGFSYGSYGSEGGGFRMVDGSSASARAGKLCGDFQSSPGTRSGERGSDGWAAGRWIMTKAMSK